MAFILLASLEVIAVIIVILIVYISYSLISDQRELDNKTDSTRFSFPIFFTMKFARPSLSGEQLLQEIIELRMNKGFFEQKTWSSYKYFDEFLLNLMSHMQRLGTFQDEVFKFVILILKKDLTFQVKAEQFMSKGASQLLLMSGVTYTFIYYGSTALDTALPQQCHWISFVSLLLGLPSITWMLKYLYHWRFRQIDQIVESALLLRSFSQFNLSIQQAINLSRVESLFRADWKNAKCESLFQWLVKIIDSWKRHGGDLTEALDHLIEQALTQREIIEEQSIGQIQMVTFLASCCFGLLPFLYNVQCLISTYLAKAF